MKKLKTGKLWKFLKKWGTVLLNPRMLLCFSIAWVLTNGWCYLFILLGTALEISWMAILGTAYLGFLWLPATPEKIVTLLIALCLMKVLFPSDQKTVAVLHEELTVLRSKFRKREKNAYGDHPTD